VAVGTQDYAVPALVARGDLNYETKYLTPGEGDNDGILILATLAHTFLTMDVLHVHAAMGAAAQSGLRLHDKLRAEVDKSIHLEQPPLAVVNQADLSVVGEATLIGRAASNTSLVEQALKASGARKTQIVEAFELS